MGAQLPDIDDGKNEEESRYDEVDRDLFIDAFLVIIAIIFAG